MQLLEAATLLAEPLGDSILHDTWYLQVELTDLQQTTRDAGKCSDILPRKWQRTATLTLLQFVLHAQVL
jgi:hypothetical protein